MMLKAQEQFGCRSLGDWSRIDEDLVGRVRRAPQRGKGLAPAGMAFQMSQGIHPVRL